MFGLTWLTPWLLGGTALAFLAASGTAGLIGYNKGYASADTKDQLTISNMQLDAERNVAKIRAAWQQQTDAAVAGLEQDKGKTNVIYRTIMEGVDHLVEGPARTVYASSCFDDDGLRLANAALAGIPVAQLGPSAPTGMPRPLTPQ